MTQLEKLYTNRLRPAIPDEWDRRSFFWGKMKTLVLLLSLVTLSLLSIVYPVEPGRASKPLVVKSVSVIPLPPGAPLALADVEADFMSLWSTAGPLQFAHTGYSQGPVNRNTPEYTIQMETTAAGVLPHLFVVIDGQEWHKSPGQGWVKK